jgi:hypothetical protein
MLVRIHGLDGEPEAAVAASLPMLALGRQAVQQPP